MAECIGSKGHYFRVHRSANSAQTRLSSPMASASDRSAWVNPAQAIELAGKYLQEHGYAQMRGEAVSDSLMKDCGFYSDESEKAICGMGPI